MHGENIHDDPMCGGVELNKKIGTEMIPKAATKLRCGEFPWLGLSKLARATLHDCHQYLNISD